MSTTIPALDPCSDILDTDLILITHSNGVSEKTTGEVINKRSRAIIASSTTITGGVPLKTGNIVKIFFTVALTAANGSTALAINYNGVNYTVKVPRNGALEDYKAFNLGSGTYKYLQANTELDLLYNGTNLIILGNPLVLSDTDYSIFADGLKRVDAVTANDKGMVTSGAVKTVADTKADYADLAPTFSTTTAYAVGQYVIYSGNLYRCTVVHSAGNWNASHFTAVTVGGELKDKANQTDIAVPSDAVVHYSFDDVPDYPDGSADVRLLNNNTYDLMSTLGKFQNNGGCTFSNLNGNLQTVIEGSNPLGVIVSYTFTANKIIKFKIKISELTGDGVIKIYNGTSRVVKSIDKIGVYEIIFLSYSESTLPNFMIRLNNTSSTRTTFELLEFYVGTGSYNTPIIDNTGNGINAVNNGGLAVQGVSGKGVRTFGNVNQPLYKETPSIIGDITVSIWGINYGNAGAYSLIATDQLSSNVNWRINYNNANGSKVIAKIGETYTTEINIEANVIHHFVLTVNGTSAKFYVDSVLVDTKTVSGRVANNIIKLGGDLANAQYALNGMIDDFQIFNRALSAEEVQTLYLNKANTPKYYNLNNYNLERKLPPAPSADGDYTLKVSVSSGVETYSWEGSATRSIPEPDPSGEDER